MIALIRTEFTRLRWRRAILLLVAGCFVAATLIGVGTAWNTRPYDKEEVAEALADAQQNKDFRYEVRQCERHPKRYGVPSAERCEETILGWYANLYREPLSVYAELHNSGVAVASVVLLLMILAGTTFAGADWNSGSMSNQLLFEPRRLRVWTAKAIAVGILAALVAVVVLTLYWLALLGVSASRDLTLQSGVPGEIAWMVARCTGLASLGAVGGYALTMLSRSTVFTLSVTAGISIAGSILVEALPLGDHSQRWLPGQNVLAVMQGQAAYWPESQESRAVLTVWGGLAYILVPCAIVIGLSIWSFRRHDVP